MSTESFTMDSAVWTKVKLPPWWLVLIEGILLILLGIFFFVSPYQTLVSAVWALGLYWFVRGIIDVVSLIWDRRMWGWKIISGALGIIAGWILFQQPLAGSLVLSATMVYFLGFIGLFIGISSLIRGIQGAGWGTLILGVVEIILSVILLANAGGAASWMPYVLGGLAILGGLIALFAAFALRRIENTVEAVKTKVAAQAQQIKAAGSSAKAASAKSTAAAKSSATAAAKSATKAASNTAKAVDDATDGSIK